MLVALRGFSSGLEAAPHEELSEIVEHRGVCPDVQRHIGVLGGTRVRGTSFDSVQENRLAADQDPTLRHHTMDFEDSLPRFLLFGEHCGKFNGRGCS
ncbi:hypothetical protein AR689_05840 [Arthrobacter sp. EpRS71]|nr:hypothetical protein AR689_05840 [Arthrobacter sp. EpRS71]